jgi:hypothetical protein
MYLVTICPLQPNDWPVFSLISTSTANIRMCSPIAAINDVIQHRVVCSFVENRNTAQFYLHVLFDTKVHLRTNYNGFKQYRNLNVN